MGGNLYYHNLMLSINQTAYDMRLRTTVTDYNGLPSVGTAQNEVGLFKTQVVYTRASDGTAKLYVRSPYKAIVVTDSVTGTTSNWGQFPFALGNEIAGVGGRPFLGSLHRVAVYNKALSEAEIDANYVDEFGESPPTIEPGVPTITASDGDYTDRVHITWAAVDYATYYKVYRSATELGVKSLLSQPTGTSYDDFSATVDTTFYYWVKAFNDYGGSDYSAYDTGYRSSTPSEEEANWWVDAVNGNDSFSGQSAQTPFRTISKAATVATEGNLIYVREGTYHEKVDIYCSGSSGKPIVFKNYPTETPVIDGQYILPTGVYDITTADTLLGFVYSGLVQIYGDYVTFDGFTVYQSRGRGIFVYGSHCTVQNCTVTAIRSTGILAGPLPAWGVRSYNTVHNCSVSDCNSYLEGTSLPWPTWGPCIQMKYVDNATVTDCTCTGRGEGIIFAACRTGLIRGNDCYNNVNTGIWIYYSQDVVAFLNFVYSSYATTCANGIGTGLDVGVSYGSYVNQRNWIIGNLVVNRRWNFGYAAYGTYPTEDGGLKDCVFACNTSVHANMNGTVTSSLLRSGIYIKNAGDRTGAKFYNNVILQDLTKAPFVAGGGQAACTWGWNSFFNTTGATSIPSGCTGTGTITADPRLTAPSTLPTDATSPYWYTLLSASPCIDAGTDVSAYGVNIDMIDNPRPAGSGYDMGWHEKE